MVQKQKRHAADHKRGGKEKGEGDSDEEGNEEGDSDKTDEDDDIEKRERKKTRKDEKMKEKQRNATKVGRIGHYVSSKPMIYSPDGDQLEPEKGSAEPKKLIDLTEQNKRLYISKEDGYNYTSRVRAGKQMDEEAFLRAEEERLGKAEREAERLRKLEEVKRKDEKEQQMEK